MDNKTFYYRFQKENGKTAIGQLRFIELKALLCNIRINGNNNFVMGIKNPIAAKAIVAPNMEIIDLNETPINIYTTFEDAVKESASISSYVSSYTFSDYRQRNVFCTHLQDILDTLNENLVIHKYDYFGYDWCVEPITYKWDGTKPKQVSLKNKIAYNFITETCYLVDENYSLVDCYQTKEECQNDNAVECYTFQD